MQIDRKLRIATSVLALIFVLAWPLRTVAQQPAKLPHIGFLWLGYGGNIYGGVVQELKALGWVEGKNVVFDYRYADEKPERLEGLAAELVRLNVDVLVAHTSSTAFAARNATSTIPIVVYAAHAGVETGLFASLVRPGGNVTGSESLAPELDAKRVELMKQIVPSISQLAVLFNPSNQGSQLHLKSTRAAAQSLGIAVTPVEVRKPEEFDSVFAALDSKAYGGLLYFTDEVTSAMPLPAYQVKRRLPVVCEFEFQTWFGCLLSYGPLLSEFDQVAAAQVDRILKGAKPAEMAVQQMTRYELVVNKKTARAIGLTIPPSILVRADKVIE